MRREVEFGVKYPGMEDVLKFSTQSAATAAVERANQIPCGKGAKLMRRQVIYYTDWE